MQFPDDRIGRIERELRMYRALSAIGLFLLMFLILGATDTKWQQDTSVVRAQGLEVINEQGTVVARIQSDIGGGKLQLFAKSGERMVELSVAEGVNETVEPPTGSIVIFQPGGKALVSIDSLDPSEGGSLMLYGADGMPVYAILPGCHGNCVNTLKGEALEKQLGFGR